MRKRLHYKGFESGTGTGTRGLVGDGLLCSIMGVYDKESNENSSSDKRINAVSPFEVADTLSTIADVVSWTNDTTFDVLNKLRGWGDGFATFLEGVPLGGVVRRDNGLVTRGVPPLQAYEECKKRDGLAVWDQHGWWHCLFPRAEVRDGVVPAREDVEEDSENKYGLFFRNIDDLMSWRATMRAHSKGRWETRVSGDDGYGGDGDDGDVVSRVQSSWTKTLPNGDIERQVTEKVRRRDGSRFVTERHEIVGPDGTVKESSETSK